MIQHIKYLAVAAITAVLVACGGGGDDVPFFGGNHSIKLNLISNNCNAAVPGSIVGTLSVNQNDRDIAFNIDNQPFTGKVDEDNGGYTTTNKQVINGVTVESKIAARTETAGSSYSIRYSVTANPCSAIYTGTATKI